jgi:hypothetical protein
MPRDLNLGTLKHDADSQQLDLGIQHFEASNLRK